MCFFILRLSTFFKFITFKLKHDLSLTLSLFYTWHRTNCPLVINVALDSFKEMFYHVMIAFVQKHNRSCALVACEPHF